MKKENLNESHYIFGNKGAVWSNKAHIAKSGQSTTLCGVPMLSSNWAREVEDIGCVECISHYHQILEIDLYERSAE